MIPYYDESGITIYHGDALEVLPSIATGFDVGFADPPYNYGMDYGPGHNDKLPADDYEAWCASWFDLLRERSQRIFVTPGHGNLVQWLARKPAGIAAWYKPGNPSGAGIFQWCEWEPILVWGKGRIGGSDVYQATINTTFNRRPATAGHPCPKPVRLLMRLLVAAKGTSVIDPFIGSGTTLVAAKQLNMRAIGIEQNEQFCKMAVKRLAQEVLDLGGAA